MNETKTTTEDPFAVAAREVPKNIPYFVTLLVMTPIMCTLTLVAIATVYFRLLRKLEQKYLRTAVSYVAMLDSVLMTCVLFHDVIMTSYELGITPKSGFFVYAYLYLGTRPVKFVVAIVMIWSLAILLYERLKSTEEKQTRVHALFLSAIAGAIVVQAPRWFDTTGLYERAAKTGETRMTRLIPRHEFKHHIYIITMDSVELVYGFLIPIFGFILPILVSTTVKYTDGKYRDRHTLTVIILTMVSVCLQTPHWMIKTLALITYTSDLHFPNVKMISMGTEFTFNLTPLVRCAIYVLCSSPLRRRNAGVRVVLTARSDIFPDTEGDAAHAQHAQDGPSTDDCQQVLIPVVAVRLHSNGEESPDSSNSSTRGLLRSSQKVVRWKSPQKDSDRQSNDSAAADTDSIAMEKAAIATMNAEMVLGEGDQAMASPAAEDIAANSEARNQSAAAIEYKLPEFLDDIGREMEQYEHECSIIETMHQKSNFQRHMSLPTRDRDVIPKIRMSTNERRCMKSNTNQKLGSKFRDLNKTASKSQTSIYTNSSDETISPMTSSVMTSARDQITSHFSPEFHTDSGCDSMNSDSDIRGQWVYTNPAYDQIEWGLPSRVGTQGGSLGVTNVSNSQGAKAK